MNNKLNQNIELFLQTPKGIKKSWIRTLITYTLCAIAFIIFISLSFTYGVMSNIKDRPDNILSNSFYQVTNIPYLESATWISVAGLCVLGVPFIYLFSVWMIGINEVSKSPKFHLFIWVCGFILAILALVAMILFIRASIFSINSPYIVFPSDDDNAETASAVVNHVTNFLY